MRLSGAVRAATAILWFASAFAHDLTPRFSDNLTDAVTWDQYSLSLLGQRIFILSGEIHPFRLPVPSLWRDILEKTKAGGLNTVSIYTHWALSNPSEGVLDFDGFRSLTQFLELAKEVGVWVIVRAGPYINGETTGGGVPGWTATRNSTLRTASVEYTKAWSPYWTAIAKAIGPLQITEGGSVILVQIENEFSNGASQAEYMTLLEQIFRSNGVVVPTTHNNKGERGYTYATGSGAVDMWGLDSYPGGSVCSGSLSPVITNYNAYRNASGNEAIPLFMPEFQGGYFDPWGSTSNYSNCRVGTGPSFERVFYQALWAQAARLISFYMYYGGTSWGGLPAPVVYTSYDYGAAIPENRAIGSKHAELKMQGLFLRSARDFREASFAPEMTNLTSSDAVTTAAMINGRTGAGFWIVRHDDSRSQDTTLFTLNVTTSLGALTIPTSGSGITLLGRDARTIVTDYKFGKTHVVYSTPAVLLSTTINEIDWFVVYGSADADSVFEVMLDEVGAVRTAGDFKIAVMQTRSTTLASFKISPHGKAILRVGNTRILILEETVALTFSAPVLPMPGAFGQYFEVGSNQTVIIAGPNLVRSASMVGPVLSLIGDTDQRTTLEIFGLPFGTVVTWNGQLVFTSLSSLGALVGIIEGPSAAARAFTPPQLSNWRYHDSLPETSAIYDDTQWTLANKTSTFLAMPAYSRSSPQLLGEQDYGFVTGNVLWRGHFEATGNESALYLAVNGGSAFAASVWLNDVWIGSMTSWNSSDSDVKNGTFAFPAGTLADGANVVTVLKDNMGLNEASGTNGIKQARGIVGYGIVGGNMFTEWKVQGNLGGDTAYPDKTRGVLNEGGLYAERAGWHLPGFDDFQWVRKTPMQGLNQSGVGFFRTTFSLNVPAGHDMPMSFFIQGGNATRMQLYVNGWQMGKYVANIGPQHVFPVHEGILNYHGMNTVAVSLWAVGNQTADMSISSINFQVDAVFRGGVPVQVHNPGWEKRQVF